jgi:photosystem II stability/assembly factor-like uncharacterized protein
MLVVGYTAHSQGYWSPVASGTTKRLLSVSFGSSSVGYISGNDSLLLKTTDGGKSWLPQYFTGMTLPASANDIVQVNFLSATVGYAVVSNADNPVYVGSTFKTSNGGATWAPMDKTNIAIYRTFFFSEDNGYQIGSAFFAGHTVEKLTAGVANNLKYFTFMPQQFLYGVDFYDTSTGIVGGDNGIVYRTFNAGQSWDTVKTNVDSTINAIRYLSRSNLIAMTNESNGSLIRSIDSGRTWVTDHTSITFFYPQMKSIVRSKRDSLISVGAGPATSPGVIYWYHHAGMPIYTVATQHLNEVAMRDDSVAYIVGDSGLILTNSKYILQAGSFTALQNSLKVYPNPGSRIINVEANAPHTLAVYSATGSLVKEVSTFSKSHTVSLEGCPRGVYLITITAGNGDKITRRLVLE